MRSVLPILKQSLLALRLVGYSLDEEPSPILAVEIFPGPRNFWKGPDKRRQGKKGASSGESNIKHMKFQSI